MLSNGSVEDDFAGTFGYSDCIVDKEWTELSGFADHRDKDGLLERLDDGAI
jgi:hypothetical protein